MNDCTYAQLKRPEEATVICYTNGSGWTQYIRFAIPCDGNEECFDGQDEKWCKFSKLVLPCLLFGTGFILLFSLFWYLKKHVNERIQIIMKKPEYPTSSGSLRLIQIAILTEIENRTEAVKIFIHDANTHKGCTICYFKVIIFYTVPLNMFKICYNSYL